MEKNGFIKRCGVSPATLLVTAGVVWIVAGANLLRIGIGCWFGITSVRPYMILESVAVFLFFFGFIFHRLFVKHSARIAKKKEKNCPFAFFDIKGWIVMVGMILFGIVARRMGLFPESFTALFYTGLGSALMGTGIRFLFRR